ncbi:MAG: DUF3426 domain-containing protein [Gammaproteobacteria bacterium]|nr:DUF3426 domain-containing protein [Gammaproteobacteria bacterium]
MFTRCPACLTQFRVRARQLSAAGGRVRCGACGQAFDAVSRLSDQPLPPVTDPYNHADEPVRSYEGDTEELDLPQGLRTEDDDEFVLDAMAVNPATPGSTVVDTHWSGEGEDSSVQRHTGRWLAVAVLLVIIGLGQAVWFNRDRVYDYFPQLLPWAERLCERLDCQVYRLRQPASIELINRDVRDHPVYKDALLVNATIANRSGSRQPYPRIQLALFDTNGRALAYREFAPTDYLDASLPVSAGMPPDTPVHVVLELSAATAGAVSFEFGFL